MSRKSVLGLELSESLGSGVEHGFAEEAWCLVSASQPAFIPVMAPSVILRDLEGLTVETLAPASKSSFPLFSILQMATPQPVLGPGMHTVGMVWPLYGVDLRGSRRGGYK